MFTVNWKTVAKDLGGIAGVGYNWQGRNARVTTCRYLSRIYRAYTRARAEFTGHIYESANFTRPIQE